MPTFTKCEPGKAHGLSFAKTRAAYGMKGTYNTIAPAYRSDASKSAPLIVQASWGYTPGRSTLVKGTANPER